MPEMSKDLANSKDMLVKLYALPAIDKLLMTLKNQNIVIRKAYAQEKLIVTNWVKENFNQAWANECEIAFNMQPIVCFIAINAEKIIGFATYNTTSLGVAGPIGIDKNFRKNSIAKALSIYGMNNMKHCGY